MASSETLLASIVRALQDALAEPNTLVRRRPLPVSVAYGAWDNWKRNASAETLRLDFQTLLSKAEKPLADDVALATQGIGDEDLRARAFAYVHCFLMSMRRTRL